MTLTPEILRRLYLEEHKTETEIGVLFSMSQTTVGRRRAQWGIPTILKSDRLDLPNELTARQRSILIGSMLGDGGIRASGQDTAIFYEQHCSDQRHYLDWKSQELAPFVGRVSDVVHIKGFSGATLETHAARVFRPYYDLFYPDASGRHSRAKTPRLIDPTQVDAIALAIWFMDDGCRSGNYARLTVSPHKADQRVMLYALQHLGFLHCRVYETRKDCRILIDGRTDYNHFLDLVDPHILPEFRYKLAPRGKEGPAPRDFFSKNRLEEFLERGLTVTKISKETGYPRTSVRRALANHGLR